MSNRAFEQYDNSYEIVDNPTTETGLYCIRILDAPFAGVEILPQSFHFTELPETDEVKMDFQYKIVTSVEDTDVLENDIEFKKCVSNIILNLYEKNFTPVEDDQEIILDGDGEDTCEMKLYAPDGEVKS